MSETKQPFVINGDQAEEKYFAFIRDLRKEHPYLIVKYPRFGEKRSLDQNALFHCFIFEMAAHYFKTEPDDLTSLQLFAMKRSVKVNCLLENPNFREWLITENIPDPIGGKKGEERKKDGYASSADWGRDGMYHVLTWMQVRAAWDGLMLESKGKFEERQLSQTE